MSNLIALRDYFIAGLGNVGIKIRLTDNGDGTYSEGLGGGGGGGGGGAVTIAAGAVATGAYVAGSVVDGADVTQGAKADATATSDAGAFSVVALLKRQLSKMAVLGAAATAAATPVTVATDDAQFGAEYTGYAQDTGGSGLRGTLSTIAKAVRLALTVQTVDVTVASTNITAQNLNPNAGAATANSTVAVALSGQSTVIVTVTANTLGSNCFAQVSGDGINWVTASWYVAPTTESATSNGVIATGVTGQFEFKVGGMKGFRLSANSAGVAGTLSAALNASVGTPQSQNVNLAWFNNATATPIATAINPGGGVSQSLVVTLSAGPVSTDYSNVNWATASGNAAAINSLGAGAVCSFDVSVTAYAAGSSTGLDIWLQWSPDNGTTWYDLWQCERVTATGHLFIPALYIPGRRRMRWANAGAAATTATVNVTSNGLSLVPPVQRQGFDRTTNVLNGTAAAFTTTLDISGCRNLLALVTLGTAGTAATYQWQISADGTNWANVGTAVLATATATTAVQSTTTGGRFGRLIVTIAGVTQVGTVVALTAC